MKYILIIVIWNILTCFIVGIDKMKAIKGKYRISENFLIIISFIMGGIGVETGMIIFHHKISKVKFRILIPLSIIFNFFLLYIYYKL